MKKIAKKIYAHVINPPSDEELAKAWHHSDKKLPTIWMLGKTGAGKSTIIQKLTGHTDAEIGNGYMPCTKDSRYFDYPQHRPILRFLDTRGLGEVDYDASDDLKALSHSSHAVLVVSRIGDGEQSSLLDALTQIRKSAKHIQNSSVAVVHTGALEIQSEHDRQRAIEAKQTTIERAWGSPVDHCVVDFSQSGTTATLNDFGADQLKEMIVGKVPELSLWLRKRDHKSAEQGNFDKLGTDVLWYAGTAAASDAIPVVGLVSVPAIQGKMLHSLAQKYGIVWNTKNFSEFIAALGTSFALRYAVSLGARQLGKLIPGYGQLVGAAFAVTVSYGSTYALGRTACSYLYHKKTDTPIDDNALRQVFEQALEEGKETAKNVSADRDK